MPLTNFTSYKSDLLNKMGGTSNTNANTNMNTYGSRFDNLLQNTKSNTLDSKYNNSNTNTLLGKDICVNFIRSKVWKFSKV